MGVLLWSRQGRSQKRPAALQRRQTCHKPMATNQTNSDDKTAMAALDDRDARALTEYMTTISKDAPGLYAVTTQSGREYTVDARDGSCTCPDARHRDNTCKHIRRVRFAVGRRTIPDWANDEAIDSQLGDHVQNERAVADGGSVESEKQPHARITGPHPEFDKYGQYTGSDYWRCTGCGAEAIRRSDLDKCCEAKR